MNDRDVYIPKHPTPSPGVPAFVDEEATGKYDGEQLATIRAKRPTDKRLAKLEEKHDAVDSKVDAIGQRVARMEGTLETIADVLVPERREAHKTERARIDSRTKIIIAVVGLIGTAIGVLVGSGCS